jgi:hypothetical protein
VRCYGTPDSLLLDERQVGARLGRLHDRASIVDAGAEVLDRVGELLLQLGE